MSKSEAPQEILWSLECRVRWHCLHCDYDLATDDKTHAPAVRWVERSITCPTCHAVYRVMWGDATVPVSLVIVAEKAKPEQTNLWDMQEAS